MSNNKELLSSLLVNLKSVIQSCKGGVAVSDLQNDYKQLIGTNIPFESLGYKSLETFLIAIPDVVKLKKNSQGQLFAEAISDTATAHLAKLISKQRDNKPNHKRRFSKRIAKANEDSCFPNSKGSRENRIHEHKRRFSKRIAKPNEDNYFPNSKGSRENRIHENFSQQNISYGFNRNVKNYTLSKSGRDKDNRMKNDFSQQNSSAKSNSNVKNYTLSKSERDKENIIQKGFSQRNFITIERPNSNIKSFAVSRSARDKEKKGTEKKVILTDTGSLSVVINNVSEEPIQKRSQHATENKTSFPVNRKDTDVKQLTRTNNVKQKEINQQCFQKSESCKSESNIVFIRNLVRPFTLLELKEMLKKTGNLIEERLWINKLRSKCFAIYETKDEAFKTQAALNGIKWPMCSPKYLLAELSTESELKHICDIESRKHTSENMPLKEKQYYHYLDRISDLNQYNLRPRKDTVRHKPYENKHASDRKKVEQTFRRMRRNCY